MRMTSICRRCRFCTGYVYKKSYSGCFDEEDFYCNCLNKTKNPQEYKAIRICQYYRPKDLSIRKKNILNTLFIMGIIALLICIPFLVCGVNYGL